MDARAAELIRTLNLAPHPEGGAFAEVFRSSITVPGPGGGSRPAATHIYFMLVAGQHSRWHRVAHDELWHFYEGDPVELSWVTGDGSRIERRILGTVAGDHRPVAVVPAGCWQMARTSGACSLAGCTVAPGFDFADFALLIDAPEEAARLRERFPDHADFPGPASG